MSTEYLIQSPEQPTKSLKEERRRKFISVKSAQEAFTKLALLTPKTPYLDEFMQAYANTALISFAPNLDSKPVFRAQDTTDYLKDQVMEGKRNFDELVLDNQPLVISRVTKLIRPGEEIGDFVSAVQPGLMKSVARFELDRDNELSSFAVFYIDGAIKAYRHSMQDIRHRSYKNIREVEEAENQYFLESGFYPSTKELAGATRLSAMQINGAKALKSRTKVSLDRLLEGQEDCRDTHPALEDSNQEFVENLVNSQETKERAEEVEKALAALPEPLTSVARARFIGELTIKEVSQQLGIPERSIVRYQLQAIELLRELVTSPGGRTLKPPQGWVKIDDLAAELEISYLNVHYQVRKSQEDYPYMVHKFKPEKGRKATYIAPELADRVRGSKRFKPVVYPMNEVLRVA
jgi:RNA polymerase sigma factor (sigma-70 family)